MKFGLKQKTIDRIVAVFAEHQEIDKVIIYGSRSVGNYKNGSDIDLSMLGHNISFTLLNSIALKLDDLMLPYTIDLSIFHQIENQDLRDHIDRRGTVFYDAESSLDDSSSSPS